MNKSDRQQKIIKRSALDVVKYLQKGGAACLLISIAPVFTANALDFDYAARYGFDYSDNIFRAPDDEESEYIHRVGLGFSLDQEGRTLSARAAGNLDYAHYAENTRSDEILPQVDAFSTWKIRQETLEWQFINYTRQVQIDTADPDTPSNTQTTNIFLTGPDANFRLGSISSIQVQARYGKYYFDKTNEDSVRNMYALRFIRGGTAVTSSVNAEYSSAEYDSSEDVNFNKLDSYVSGEWRRSRNEFVTNLGWTHVDRDDTSSVDGPLVRLLWNYGLTSSSELHLSGSAETTDSGSFIPRIALTGIGTGGVGFDSPDIVQSKRAEAAYTRESASWSHGIRAYAINLDYEDDPRDRDIVGVDLNFSRPFSLLFVGSLILGYADTDWGDLSRDDTDKSIEARFGYSLSSQLRISAGGGWFDRDSNDPLQEYTEIRASAGIDYDFPR